MYVLYYLGSLEDPSLCSWTHSGSACGLGRAGFLQVGHVGAGGRGYPALSSSSVAPNDVVCLLLRSIAYFNYRSSPRCLKIGVH